MKPFKRAVAITGTYHKAGETKKRYTNIGTLFQGDDGSLSLKIDAIPAGNTWDGWVSFYDFETRQ